MTIIITLASYGINAGPYFKVVALPSGTVLAATESPWIGPKTFYGVPAGTNQIRIDNVYFNGNPGLCSSTIFDITLLDATTTTTTTGGVTPPTTSTTTTGTTSSTTTTTTTSGPVPPTSTSTSTTTSSTSSTTSTTTTGTSSSSTTTTSTTVECPDCYWYDLYCDGQVGESSVFDMVECNGTVVEQSVPYEANGTMIFCLQNDPVIRPLGIPGHFIKGEICGNVCDTTTTTTTVHCATIESYLGYDTSSAIDACSASTLSYWGDVAIFADCTILYRDQYCTLLAYEGYYSDGIISRYWTGTEFSGLDTSCLDICYEYNLYCDGVEGESSLFAYRDCSGQYEEQTVPYEASPWTLCSTVVPQSIGAIAGHVMGGSVLCTTTTTTTVHCATIESYLGYDTSSAIDACSASTLSYWGDVAIFADCTILYRDQYCTLLAYEGYYSDGIISRYWTGTEFSGLDTSCLDICYEYNLYCDGVEGESSLFAYRDCSGQYEEQTVPYEASPWTLCSTVVPQSIGAIAGHVMGGSVLCTTTTTTTVR